MRRFLPKCENFIQNNILQQSPFTIKNCRGPISRSDIYFDTQDLRLLKSGCCFRFGSKAGNLSRLTFKEKTKDKKTRVEVEDFLPTNEAIASFSGSHPSDAVVALREKIGNTPIAPKLYVYKMFFVFEANGCEIVFGPDVYMGDENCFRRFDLEIEKETEGSDNNGLILLGMKLEERYGLCSDFRSKYEVGMSGK